MRHRLSLVVLCAVLAGVLFAAPATARAVLFNHLKPGEFNELTQEIPINVVFVGYDDDAVDVDQMLGVLPSTYKPVARVPQFYGISGRDLGLNYTFSYNVYRANNRFENRFFDYLKEIGEAGPPTYFQQCYSGTAPALPDGEPDPCNQTQNLREIDRTLYIDAPSVEHWLEERSEEEFGLDERRGYTIFFVNWWGRDDFRYHVYTKTDEPDPDTGYNFGEIRASRKMIAWGGSSGRAWFYDLSAGPEWRTANFVVDVKDLDENGVEDYRMPPIWEYDHDGYRDPSALSTDLGKVARYVAINLLFTTAPLYDPLVTAPNAAGRRVIDITMLEGDPNSSGTDVINPTLIRNTLQDLQPYYSWLVRYNTIQPVDEGAAQALRIFNRLEPFPAGYCKTDPELNQYGEVFDIPEVALYCYFLDNRDRYISPYREPDYVSEVYAFNVTDEDMGNNLGLLGFADDNWRNGTQSYIFEFDTPTLRQFGYGFSITTIHELGHHYGLSHPHDGYDAEQGIDYGPADDFFYAWSGDESNTVMSYLDVSLTFGQFDQDNMQRYETAGLLNEANRIAGEIMASGLDLTPVTPLLLQADKDAGQALGSFERWNYRGAAVEAYNAYKRVSAAAVQLDVPLDPVVNLGFPAPNANRPFPEDPRPYLDE